MTSFRLIPCDEGDELYTARFPTREQAEEVATATEYAGDGYFAPRVAESDEPANTTAADYMAAVWSDYPGPVPAGVDPCDWFAGECE